ncbi:MAG: DUF4271 domain-containing protein [Chitinophagaceae bacterium]
MLLRFYRLFLLLFLFFFSGANPLAARVSALDYGIVISPFDSIRISKSYQVAADSIVHMTSTFQAHVEYQIVRRQSAKNRSTDFYFLLALVIILGLIRYSDGRYFSLITGAFRSGVSRQWQEMLQASIVSNVAMNVFFCAVAGIFVYYLAAESSTAFAARSKPLMMLLLILGMMMIYIGKYLVLHFAGWAFSQKALSSEYLFQVFLVNKITGIVLLPFVILLAFAGSEWLVPITVVSSTIVAAMLFTRYLRSWPAMQKLFRGSAFHFFTYLCASEILPMAVLVKWMIHMIS